MGIILWRVKVKWNLWRVSSTKLMCPLERCLQNDKYLHKGMNKTWCEFRPGDPLASPWTVIPDVAPLSLPLSVSFAGRKGWRLWPGKVRKLANGHRNVLQNTLPVAVPLPFFWFHKTVAYCGRGCDPKAIQTTNPDNSVGFYQNGPRPESSKLDKTNKARGTTIKLGISRNASSAT